MKLLNAGGIRIRRQRDAERIDRIGARRMRLCVIFRRTDIDLGIAAGAFLRLAIALRSLLRRSLVRRLLGPVNRGQ